MTIKRLHGTYTRARRLGAPVSFSSFRDRASLVYASHLPAPSSPPARDSQARPLLPLLAFISPPETIYKRGNMQHPVQLPLRLYSSRGSPAAAPCTAAPVPGEVMNKSMGYRLYMRYSASNTCALSSSLCFCRYKLVGS